MPDEPTTKLEIETPDDLAAALHADRLIAFFEAHAGDVIGHAGDEESCPIATYLVRCTTAQEARVRGDLIRVDADPQIKPPRWIRRFISRVDRELAGTGITGGQALQQLEIAIENTEAKRDAKKARKAAYKAARAAYLAEKGKRDDAAQA